MSEDYKVYFGINVMKLFPHEWRFGISLNKDSHETYLCLSLFKYLIYIGRLIKWED